MVCLSGAAAPQRQLRGRPLDHRHLRRVVHLRRAVRYTGAGPPRAVGSVTRRSASLSSGRPAQGRLQQLDLLRAIAVLLVIGYHLDPLPQGTWLALPLVAWKRWGWCGVDLFFVLSGFLVSGLLFSEYRGRGSIRVGRFLVRRGLKIYPSFHILMLVTVIGLAVPAIAPHTFSRMGLLRELLFIQNYGARIWPHTWSLAVEEHFYLFVAFFTWLCASRGRGAANPFRVAVPMCAAVMLVCPVLRAVWHHVYPVWPAAPMQATHLRADGLAFGLLISYVYHFHSDAFRRWIDRWRYHVLVFSLASIVSAIVWPIETPVMHTVGLSWLYLGFGGALVWSLLYFPVGNARVAALCRPLAAVGKNSYSIYLWHVPLFEWTRPHLAGATSAAAVWLALAFYCALSIGVGVAMAAAVEFPVLRLRDRLFPSHVGATALAREEKGVPPPDAGIPLHAGEAPP